MKAIAFFDFDGTISRSDSLLKFVLYSVPFCQIVLGALRVAPAFALMFFKFRSRSQVKEKIFTIFFSGVSYQKLLHHAETFADEYMAADIRPDARNSIERHIESGDEVVIVSASPELWIQPIGKRLGVSTIATKLEVIGDLLTGKLDGPNCSGAEKVTRIMELYDLSKFSAIYAYGDSAGDIEMLNLAVNDGYRVFNK